MSGLLLGRLSEAASTERSCQNNNQLDRKAFSMTSSMDCYRVQYPNNKCGGSCRAISATGHSVPQNTAISRALQRGGRLFGLGDSDLQEQVLPLDT